MRPQIFVLETFHGWPDDVASHILDTVPRHWTYGVTPSFAPASPVLGADEAKRLLGTLPRAATRGRPPRDVLHFMLGGTGPLFGPGAGDNLLRDEVRHTVHSWLNRVLGTRDYTALAGWHYDEGLPHFHALALPVVDGILDRRLFDERVLERVREHVPEAVFSRRFPSRALRLRYLLAESYYAQVGDQLGCAPPGPSSSRSTALDRHADRLRAACRSSDFSSLAERIQTLGTAPEERMLAALAELMSTRSLVVGDDLPEGLGRLLAEGPDVTDLVALHRASRALANSTHRALHLYQEHVRQRYAAAACVAIAAGAARTDQGSRTRPDAQC